MTVIKSRIPFTPQNPYRPKRPATSKIIFLSLEGSVTEEEYFERVSEIFSEIKTKIQFISVAEDAVHTHHKNRTPQQALLLSKSRPKQLVERIEQFKIEKAEQFQFSEYKEDEFWIVADTDDNTSSLWIEEWEEALKICEEKGYGYAISNPFFEIWLLLHHDNATEEDKKYAVTKEHAYEPTIHFRERLHKLKVPLKDKKHILDKHYDREKIFQAIERAKALHLYKEDKVPKYFATTVYLLLEKMVEMLRKTEV